MTEQSAKRQTAVKAWISDIKNGTYIKAEGEWEPNFVETATGKKISRANIMGVVLGDDSDNSFTVEDGSAKITIRSFEPLTEKPTIGSPVLVIGRPREFSNEIYLLPEIIKTLSDKNWLHYRKAELEATEVTVKAGTINESGQTKEKQPTPQKTNLNKPAEEIKKQSISVEETVMETKIDSQPIIASKSIEPQVQETPAPKNNPFDIIIATITKLDTGDGADIDEVISSSGIDESQAENIINNLLMDGEAFEIRPGRLKLLD